MTSQTSSIIRKRTGRSTSFPAGHFEHITCKYHSMVEYALQEFRPDYIAIWEDDDIYLDHHLEYSVNCDRICNKGVVRNDLVWTNHPGGLGVARLYITGAPYHGSWVFTPKAYRKCGGYSEKPIDKFDIDFCSRLASHGCTGLSGLLSSPSSIPCGEGCFPRMCTDLAQQVTRMRHLSVRISQMDTMLHTQT